MYISPHFFPSGNKAFQTEISSSPLNPKWLRHIMPPVAESLSHINKALLLAKGVNQNDPKDFSFPERALKPVAGVNSWK